MKKTIAFLLTLIMVVSLTSCSSKTTIPSESANTDSKTEEDETKTFVDSTGRKVEVPVNITRIIPSGDMAQMFIWPLAADKLVSVSSLLTEEQMHYLGTECESLPETGNLYKTGSELNIEEVSSLDAQIIIDFGEAKDSIVEDLNNLQDLLGIPCVFIEGGLEDSAESYRMLGDLLGMEENAEELATYIDNIINTTTKTFEAVEKRDAVILNGSDALGCIASGTYFDEIWAYMLNNVAIVDDSQMYAATNIDFEQLANWDPEYIFFYNSANPSTIVDDATWSQLSAIKSDKYFAVPIGPYSFVSPPTVNRYLAIVWLAEIVYPNDFDWDLEAMVKEYYNLFYHYKLTNVEYTELMQTAS